MHAPSTVAVHTTVEVILLPHRFTTRLALAALTAAGTLIAGVMALSAPPLATPAGARVLGPGPAYWLAAADGGVFNFGRGAFAGAAADAGLQRQVVGMAATPTGNGYWLAAKDGGVFAFGDATYLGGTAGQSLNAAIVGIAATPTGRGYWLAAADGGVFAFGDAPYRGGITTSALNSPIVGVAASPTGAGYWLAGRDGGVFAFGDAAYLGGVAGVALNAGIAGIAAAPQGGGYWLVGRDGGVFAFGHAAWRGSAVGQPLRSAAVGIAPTRSGQGYWLAASDGGLFAFGDAGFFGSAIDVSTRGRVVGIASGSGQAIAPPTEHRLKTGFGWDVSWPQCNSIPNLPVGRSGYAIVGVTDGHLNDPNRCLAAQHRWSLRAGSLAGLYINTNYPSRAEEAVLAATMADVCPAADSTCQLYQFGVRGARHAMAVAAAAHAEAPLWWLDVETANRWSPDPGRNIPIILGVKDTLERAGLRTGVYSTPYQWQVITGGLRIDRPTWVATGRTIADAPPYCEPARSFGGGPVYMVQFLHERLDGNILCTEGLRQALQIFRAPPPPAVPEYAEDGPAPAATDQPISVHAGRIVIADTQLEAPVPTGRARPL